MANGPFEDTFKPLKRKEEVLEISSTGYGLESVSEENAEKQKQNQENKGNSSECGGL
ncbi:hypothetical protein [uncultured Metabacillus sp.]|uniref:hypothetical protein n=1 Tax=Metabacillus sp. Hm71 TaxID=3450743 RepID=UPI00262D44C8|nr:hypothetical protein [uncultured Metabacillus sp.]